MNHFLIAALLLSLAGCTSCSRGPGGGPIGEERFVRLYADVLIEREERSLRGLPATDSTAMDSIYQAYGVTAAEVDETLAAYKGSLADWKEFHVKVTRRLEELQKEMTSKRATQ